MFCFQFKIILEPENKCMGNFFLGKFRIYLHCPVTVSNQNISTRVLLIQVLCIIFILTLFLNINSPLQFLLVFTFWQSGCTAAYTSWFCLYIEIRTFYNVKHINSKIILKIIFYVWRRTALDLSKFKGNSAHLDHSFCYMPAPHVSTEKPR